MTQEALQTYLSREYQGKESFLETIIYPIFGEKNYETAFDVPVLDDDQLKALAARTGVQEIIKYGTVTIGHVVIDIFEVTVQDHVLMSRNRVTIQQLIRRIMDTYSSAFIIFHYQHNWQLDWRFSFCQKDDRNMTEAKRYTFMLGPHQACKTAAQNFLKLIGRGDNITRDEVLAAFDVEALSDEFYDKYSSFYADFVEFVTGKRIVKDGDEWKEVVTHEPHPQIYADFGRSDKAVRDYIKRTLGRIVFLHFLQKKGWMGVEPGKAWGTGDLQFMKHLYEQASEQQKDDFLDAVLEPLFDKALDTMPANEQGLFDTKVRGLANGGVLRFPYLNGGLFERDAYDRIPTRFPRELFRDFLEFLYEYNFTIDENDPNDAEVGVDPEMLGQIFENLLEDNKFKGAYYTRKEVVHYMAKEALIASLQTQIAGEEKRTRIRRFVYSYDATALSETERNGMNQRLKDIKICDPAIGSGAYPMGVLREIFRCRLALEDFSAERYADVKRHIIQNNIYGVDIEQGAVEIARLRFWLSLVVDETSPKALPNLDFKIVAGNSLLTTFNGRYVALEKSKNNVVDSQLSLLKARLAKCKTNYFTANGEEKYQCELDIKNTLLDMIELQLNGGIRALVDKRIGVGQLFGDNGKAVGIGDSNAEVSPELQLLLDEVAALRRAMADGSKPLKERSQTIIPFFDWHLMFSEIFQSEGFDIVLGNPPYVSAPNQLRDPMLAQQREDIKESGRYTTLNEKWDLYVPFMELGLKLLKPDGVLTMIVPYPLTNQKYGKKLRQHFCKQNTIQEIVDAKGYKLFKNATVENCIPQIRKGQETGSVVIAHYHSDKTITKDYSLTVQHLVQDEKTYVWNLTQEERKTNRYEGMHVLGDYCYISVGMVLHADEKIAKGEFTKDELISSVRDENHTKQYIEGKDIERYYVKRVRYLEYDTERCPGKIRRPTFPELYVHSKLMCNTLGELKVIKDEAGEIYCNHKIYVMVPWISLRGIDNKSIKGSVKKFSALKRSEMESLSNTINISYILGILNSRISKALLANLRGADLNIYPEHIRNIPIPSATKEQQQPIIDLVGQILSAKKTDPSADTSALEQQIDLLVYHLYGLTYDEVHTVDSATQITREEYETNH